MPGYVASQGWASRCIGLLGTSRCLFVHYIFVMLINGLRSLLQRLLSPSHSSLLSSLERKRGKETSKIWERGGLNEKRKKAGEELLWPLKSAVSSCWSGKVAAKLCAHCRKQEPTAASPGVSSVPQLVLAAGTEVGLVPWVPSFGSGVLCAARSRRRW